MRAKSKQNRESASKEPNNNFTLTNPDPKSEASPNHKNSPYFDHNLT